MGGIGYFNDVILQLLNFISSLIGGTISRQRLNTCGKKWGGVIMGGIGYYYDVILQVIDPYLWYLVIDWWNYPRTETRYLWMRSVI